MNITKISLVIICTFFISCGQTISPVNDAPTWQLVHEGNDDLTFHAIQFTDEKNGWMIGNSGSILHSSDGGETWAAQTSGVSATLYDISFIDNQTGWVCGMEHTILKTVDGGNSWQIISSAITFDNKGYFGVKFINENDGWVSSNYGEILKTSDSGQTWELKKKFPSGASRLVIFNQNTVYVFHGKLYKTWDGGAGWDSVSVGVPKNYHTTQFFFNNAQNGWIATENGTGGAIITEFPVLITQDGGVTWQTSGMLPGFGFETICFINKLTGWIAGFQNIYHTTDGGSTWQPDFVQSSVDNLRGRHLSFIDENHGWLLCWNGSVYAYRKQE